MTRSEIIRSLHEEYARLREENLQEHEKRMKQITVFYPEIAKLVQASHELFMQQARNLLSRPEEAEQLAKATRQQATKLRRQQEELLKEAGFPASYLDPVYRCAACRDTGYVGSGVREMCACMNKRLVDIMFESARERGTAEQRFDTFKETIFPNDVKVDGVNTQRAIALAVRNQCKEYADQYPNNARLGLLLTGETGLGKTFLLHCVENRLLQRGFSPIFVTAYRLFETMRGCHFSDPEKRQEFEQLTKCDILMIDDLGTEPIMQNITREYLFTLLNERLTQRKHTVVATNLGINALIGIYGERVFSRLFDVMNVSVTQLKGKDLRTLSRGGRK
jgi:DNA replication protein DnaC